MNELEEILKDLKNIREVNPSLKFRQEAKLRILNRINSHQRPKWLFARPFQVALALILVLLLGGAGTVFAAQSSIPSDALYPIKTASEQVLISLSTKQFKGKTALMIADRRAHEVKRLHNLGRAHLVSKAVSKYEQSIKQVQEVDNINQDLLDQHLNNHQEVLNEVLLKASPQARRAIEKALKASYKARMRR